MPGMGLPDRDLIELVRDARQADPDIPALIFEDGLRMSRARLWAELESFAGYLRSRIEPGDRVAIIMPNRAEFMLAWLAVAACRGILVALNPVARSHDAGHVLRDSAARIAIVDRDNAALVRKAGCSCVFAGGPRARLFSSPEPTSSPPRWTSSRPAAPPIRARLQRFSPTSTTSCRTGSSSAN